MARALSTEGLTKDFGGGHGLFDLDLEVHAGEIFGFIGANGAGKTTAMRLLLGLLRPTRGRAEILGHDVARDGLAARRQTGFLPSDAGLYPRFTGTEMLRHLARLRGGGTDGVASLAERLGAPLDRPIGDLSRGNRQKLALVQALMHDPPVLILDEPISGLDPLVQHHLHELLLERRDRGVTVFLSSHTLSEVERVADRIGVLRGGRLTDVDTIDGLRSIATRTLDLAFAGDPPTATFRSLPGVTAVEADGHWLRIAYRGTPDALVKAAARHEIVELRSPEPDLEELFLGFYREREA